jgi:hypothetical protein
MLVYDLTDHLQLNVGPDYGAIEFTPQIGKQKQCVLIWIFPDDEVERNEEFTIQLHSDHPLVTIQNGVANVVANVTAQDDTTMAIRSYFTMAVHSYSTMAYSTMAPTTENNGMEGSIIIWIACA